MKRYDLFSGRPLVRRACVGAIAAALAFLVVCKWSSASGTAFPLCFLVGIAYSMMVPPLWNAWLDQAMTGAVLGFLVWGLLLPLRSARGMHWTAESMRTDLPALVAWVLFGALTGALIQALTQLTEQYLGPEEMPASAPSGAAKRIVILGGGFAGMKTAEYLEQYLESQPPVVMTLVSETNSLLFTPMLAEVAGSSLEPSHISAPLRTSLRHTHFMRARVTDIDLDQRRIALQGTDGGAPGSVDFDCLVLALGGVSNYLGMKDVERLSFGFKSLLDAIRIRNHTIEMFERADRETNPDTRRKLLTFVVAGGGFAGVELAGALNDFSRGILADYRNVQPSEVQVILVHAHDRILPELTETLAHYARRKMEERGVTFRLKARVQGVTPESIEVSDGAIDSHTLVWTAGTSPNPLLSSMPVEKDKRGAVIVDPTLGVLNYPGVWALGDCASVTDAKTGLKSPPTAQFALRQARTAAKNISAHLSNGVQEAFHFDSLGSLCVVGFQNACAELAVPFTRSRILQFSGLSAWLLWRGIYLLKLPGLERKIRVLLNWILELFFPRDVVQTIDLG